MNGVLCHDDCLAGLQVRLETSQAHVSELDLLGRHKEAEVARSRSLAAQVARFFARGLPDTAALEQEVELLNAEAGIARAERDRLGGIATAIYDYWPTYPPDWEDRRQSCLAAESICEDCQEAESTHVHHNTAVKDGGSHKPENLEAPCRGCHELRHGGKAIGGGVTGANSPSGFSVRLALLKRAIAGGELVRFVYTNKRGVQSVRTIRPENIEHFGDHDSVCVSGYCYLREEERTFAIRRMREAKIVAEPGESHWMQATLFPPAPDNGSD